MGAIDTVAVERTDRRAESHDPDIFGESSQAGSAQADAVQRNVEQIARFPQRRDPAHAHDRNRLEARSPRPAPAPALGAQPASPTHPPTKRSVEEPDHLRFGTDEFADLVRRDSDAGARVIGPFHPRDADELAQIKRDVSERRRRGELRPGRVGSGNLLDGRDALLRRSMPGHALDEDLLARGGLFDGHPEDVGLLRREVLEGSIDLVARQTAAQERCYVGNEDLSCYPTAGTTLVQGDWSRFIWNANYPLFIQNGYVDVYLYRQDTDDMVTSWTSLDNGAGRVSFRPNDLWWQGRQAADNIQPGQNITWPFYFVILPHGESLTGTTSRLATWSAIQTALPFAVSSSRAAASASASAASASAASAASASAASATASPTPTSTDSQAAASAVQSSLSAALESSLQASGLSGTETLAGTTTATLPNGSVITATATAQANGASLGGDRNGNGLALPTYAIVLIAVLGFLALVAAIAGAYFIMAALRKRRRAQSQRGSYGSGSPMMAAAAGSLAGASTDGGHPGETSHMLDVSGGAGAAGAAAGKSRSLRSEDSHLFTSDEATRMADAFRNALRRPEFSPAGFGEASGESPLEDTPENGGGSCASALLREELASEGKDLQSVPDRRKATFHDE